LQTRGLFIMRCIAFLTNRIAIFFILFCFAPGMAPAQTGFIYGDALPDAPALAARGEYTVGVRTVEWVNKAQINILKASNGAAPVYDRPLKAEIWYPAQPAQDKQIITTYTDMLGSAADSTRPLHAFSFSGRSLRNAPPLQPKDAFPLVIVSHGYPGSRVLLSYLTENLASKGYVVVAIDHTESTHADQAGFASTLLHRPADILFVLNQVAAFGKAGSGHFLSGLVNADNTGLIGYSMGGYGVLNVGGAGYSKRLAGFFASLTGGSKAIESRLAGNAAYTTAQDTRIKAIVAFAPWGMERGIWDSAGLLGLQVPVFLVAGNQDDVSGYEKGTKAIYHAALNADRYLLTYENARHNTAPNPPAPETMLPGMKMDDYYHYAEPAWNERKINNINQHFVSAFFGIFLQHKDYLQYLALKENVAAGQWAGFKPRTATGLSLLHANAK
jgi:predicted dienelactone hydrolase